MAVDPDKKLTQREAAKRAGLSEGHLANLRSRGGGPPFFKLGRKVVYSVGTLDAWLATKLITETPKKKGPTVRRIGAPASDHALA